MVKLIAKLSVGMCILLSAGCGLNREDIAPGRMESLSQSRVIEGEKSLAVNLEYGVGNLALSPAEPGVLYKLELEYDESRLKPVLKYRATEEGGHLDLQVEAIKKMRSLSGH